MDLEKIQSELEELYNDLDQRKLLGIILELTIENIDLKKQLSIHGVVKSLKEKKKPTFKEWQEMYNYKKVKTLFVAHGKEYYYTEVYKQYQEWLRLHF